MGPIVEMVYNGLMMGLRGFRIKGPYLKAPNIKTKTIMKYSSKQYGLGATSKAPGHAAPETGHTERARARHRKKWAVTQRALGPSCVCCCLGAFCLGPWRNESVEPWRSPSVCSSPLGSCPRLCRALLLALSRGGALFAGAGLFSVAVPSVLCLWPRRSLRPALAATLCAKPRRFLHRRSRSCPARPGNHRTIGSTVVSRQQHRTSGTDLHVCTLTDTFKNVCVYMMRR